MIINNNIPAMNTHRQMETNNQAQQESMEKLSSGMQINRAGDDAAGLNISEKMRAQINGLDQASSNAQDSISLIQTAEGALDETHDILQRMRELSVQSANDTNVDEGDREAIQAEVDQLVEEIDRISDNTEFNTQELLDGDFNGTFHIGANEDQNIELEIGDMSATGTDALGDGIFAADALTDTLDNADATTDLDQTIDVSTQDQANTAIENINDAITNVSEQRSDLGSVQNRLEHTISNLDNASENLSAAESRIRDTDMAAEMMEQTRANILGQASQSMLAQANQQPQNVLQLLQ
ncbi:flagellin [Salisediminibacterium halotolerans]|uniref:flagellin N-terminal helical domain-containing protein n=1 Tax=Salisediminibacterium halotolerans TaxID=517425 RepID=UPI000EB31D2C|nr:flagellin [Salisediminibacterium halotolerans]RLJ75537.1 flagellin [Actinophytocola xinjiangensis]RPE89390.1 flagellin [Salisediminibacterium halotolerans]TWG36150.1 flagellin [Salisediminibacterium halotolerans]GEL07627.1 flagellin [Salisediminibacterium halotolerans]